MARKETEQLRVSDDLRERHIYLIRGQQVMLNADLAEVYQVDPRALVLAIKRNPDRFPADFMFQLTVEEYAQLNAQFTISRWGEARRVLPYAFTEYGVAMLASVLNSNRAVKMNILIVRAFIKMREVTQGDAALARQISAMEVVNEIVQTNQQEHTAVIVSVVNEIAKLRDWKQPPTLRKARVHKAP